MGVLEKIAEIEAEMARTQKNKATEYHLGQLKAKLAKYRQQLLEPAGSGGSSRPGAGFDVSKANSARVVLIGFPSVGKSTFLSLVTDTESSAADYAFTTLTAIPGVLELAGAKVQLLDLPGIIEGASSGKGRGRQVIAVAKTADLILMMLDITKPDQQRELLERELEAVGIRLNRGKPDVTVKQKTGGGITINATVPMTKTDERTIRAVLQSYKLHNVDVLIREDISIDDFIDVVLGTRKYIKCLYVYNKIDAVSLETMDRMARLPNSMVVSCELKLNIEELKDRIWDMLELKRIYTKKRGCPPDFADPVVVRSDGNIHRLADAIHKSIASKLAYALVWGRSALHEPQQVHLKHVLADQDVVTLVTK